MSTPGRRRGDLNQPARRTWSRAALRHRLIALATRSLPLIAWRGLRIATCDRVAAIRRINAANPVSPLRRIGMMNLIHRSNVIRAMKRVGAAGVLSTLLMVPMLGSCASDVTRVAQSRRLDDVDLVRMTDRMAMSLAADAEVLSATSAGRIAVVMLPVRNRLTGQVLPPGEAQAFVARVRVLLSRSARDRFLFVLNRDDFDALRQAELAEDLGPSPEAINPTHALTATFLSLDSSAGRRDATYYLCQYELTDLSDRRVLWAEKYEVKKKSVGEFLD
jgi:hypothetical protein